MKKEQSSLVRQKYLDIHGDVKVVDGRVVWERVDCEGEV